MNYMNLCYSTSRSNNISWYLQGHFNLPSADSDRCLVALSIFSVICFCPVGILAVITVSKVIKTCLIIVADGVVRCATTLLSSSKYQDSWQNVDINLLPHFGRH